MRLREKERERDKGGGRQKEGERQRKPKKRIDRIIKRGRVVNETQLYKIRRKENFKEGGI